MVDRVTEYPIEVPFAEDDLRTNRNFMVGLGKLAEVLTGKQTVIQGLLCKPTTPASLNVLVEAGQIFKWENVDDTDYSALPADTTHQIVKQGIVLDETTLPCTAPATPGFSVNHLVQIAFLEVDDLIETRPFRNADDPSQPFYNDVSSQRSDKCVVTLKEGTPAATGTQLTPSPDVGNVGAWVVTVTEGQIEITALDIAEYPGAPFYKQTANIYYGSVKTDGSNNYSGTTQPPIAQYENGLVAVITLDVPNTGDSTLDLGYGAIQLLDLDGAALQSGELLAGTPYIVIYFNNKWVIQVTSTSTINSFPPGHIDGLAVQNDAGDLDHDLVFGAGTCRDYDNTIDMVNTDLLIKKIDEDWAEGSNEGGFPSTLTLTADTWYNLFMIGKVDGTVDFGYDSELDASKLLLDATGFTGYRDLGSVKTDGSGNIRLFKMHVTANSRVFQWTAPTVDYNKLAPLTSPVLVTLEVPPGKITTAQFLGALLTPSSSAILNFMPPDITPYLGPFGQITGIDTLIPISGTNQLNIITNTLSQILYKLNVTDTDTVIDLMTLGWIE